MSSELRPAFVQSPAREGPRVLLSVRPSAVRVRRDFPPAPSGRTWVLELDVEMPPVDPERLLTECEDFLVDDREGRPVGVVDSVEREGPGGSASALLLSAGWFGRRRLRVEADAIDLLVPEEGRVVVDASRVRPIMRRGAAT
jgi:hypothetical protein